MIIIDPRKLDQWREIVDAEVSLNVLSGRTPDRTPAYFFAAEELGSRLFLSVDPESGWWSAITIAIGPEPDPNIGKRYRAEMAEIESEREILWSNCEQMISYLSSTAGAPSSPVEVSNRDAVHDLRAKWKSLLEKERALGGRIYKLVCQDIFDAAIIAPNPDSAAIGAILKLLDDNVDIEIGLKELFLVYPVNLLPGMAKSLPFVKSESGLLTSDDATAEIQSAMREVLLDFFSNLAPFRHLQLPCRGTIN